MVERKTAFKRVKAGGGVLRFRSERQAHKWAMDVWFMAMLRGKEMGETWLNVGGYVYIAFVVHERLLLAPMRNVGGAR